MPRYIDADELIRLIGIDALCNKPYSKRDALACVKAINTADVVPRSEVDQWYHGYHVIKDELKREKMYHKETEKLADKYCAELQTAKAELEKYRSVVERDIVIVGRRQGKEAESREIIRYRADLIREAAVREFAESLLEGRVGNDPVSVAVRVGLKSFLEEEREEDDH